MTNITKDVETDNNSIIKKVTRILNTNYITIILLIILIVEAYCTVHNLVYGDTISGEELITYTFISLVITSILYWLYLFLHSILPGIVLYLFNTRNYFLYFHKNTITKLIYNTVVYDNNIYPNTTYLVPIKYKELKKLITLGGTPLFRDISNSLNINIIYLNPIKFIFKIDSNDNVIDKYYLYASTSEMPECQITLKSITLRKLIYKNFSNLYIDNDIKFYLTSFNLKGSNLILNSKLIISVLNMSDNSNEDTATIQFTLSMLDWVRYILSFNRNINLAKNNLKYNNNLLRYKYGKTLYNKIVN